MSVGSIIGFDISDKCCQVSYYNERKQEPQTLEVAADNYQIPLMLTVHNDKWSFGRESRKMAALGRGYTATNLWNRACVQDKVRMGDKEYEAVWVLAKFISLFWRLLKISSILHFQYRKQMKIHAIC